MPPKNRKALNEVLTRTAPKFNTNFNDTVVLPQCKGATKYFQNYCDNLKSYSATFIVKNGQISIFASSPEVLEAVRLIIEKEVKSFTKNTQKTDKIIPPKKISPIITRKRRDL